MTSIERIIVQAEAAVADAEADCDRLRVRLALSDAAIATLRMAARENGIRFGTPTSDTSECLQRLASYITAKDIMSSMRWSKAKAYSEMGRAGAKKINGTLRIEQRDWEQYIWQSGCESVGTSGTGVSTSITRTVRSRGSSAARDAPTRRRLGPFERGGSEKPLIPTTQPRKRP